MTGMKFEKAGTQDEAVLKAFRLLKKGSIINPATVSWIKVVGMLPTHPTLLTPPTQNSPKLDH